MEVLRRRLVARKNRERNFDRRTPMKTWYECAVVTLPMAWLVTVANTRSERPVISRLK